MKTKCLLPVLLLLFINACDQGEDPQPITPQTDPLLGLITKSLQVKLPEGSNADITRMTVYSNELESEISTAGAGKVFSLAENPAFAYLFDKDDNLLLAGLVGPGRSDLSIETTTEFLLYHAFAVPFEDDFVAEEFFKQVRQFPIWAQAVTMVREQFAADPQMLGKEEIGTNINALINPLLPESRILPAARRATEEDLEKASDLLMNGDIRSGLQVFQTGLNEFTVANTARRRVHGYLYKRTYVDQNDIEHKVNLYPSSSSKEADQEILISMVNGVTGISSTIYDYLIGETEKSFRVTTEPISIPLLEEEKQVDWSLRIFGVGTGTGGGKNSTEISRIVKLQMTTLTLDFVVPLIADVISVKGLVSKAKPGPKGEADLWEAMITAVTGYVEKMPEVKAKMDNGEYMEAGRDFFNIGYNQFGSIFLSDLAEIAAETIFDALPANMAKPSLESMKNSAARKVKIIGAIDLVLKGSDYARKTYDIRNSKNMEVWPIKASEIEINLEPRESTIEVSTEKKLTAYIKSTIAEGQVLEYQWSSTGKYGYLKDDRGHEGNSFTSSLREAVYVCTAEADPDQSNRQDTVSVDIYLKVGMKKYKVGKNHAILKVGDKEMFSVNWEPKVHVREILSFGRPEWIVSGGSFEATFTNREGAKAYDLQNVRADGTKAPAIRRTPAQLGGVVDGTLTHRVAIGSVSIFITQSVAQRDARIALIEKQLEDVKHNYSRLEVTVIR
ncbi:hypothetical protein [Lunatibacter salilacus]|uniref:hypothetical protein n=1 Tax=Lunatibacter salilacus TaxID=2483804 RepID=UPI00131DA8D0|nr:hypothetical protein [Lunatibacter salilacus]